jgi:hypothetical protein
MWRYLSHVIGPYREPAIQVVEVPRHDPEARIIHGMLATLGSARVALALALEEGLGAEATIAIVFAALGFAGLARARKKPPLP